MKILKRPLVELIIKPFIEWDKFDKFLDKNYNKTLVLDEKGISHKRNHYDGDMIPMLAGKTCYKSWSVGKSNPAEYLQHIIEMGHGSVLEHANFGMVVTTTRAITHEIVRHRSGWAYSQESQRFCDEKDNAFIMPLSIQGVPQAEEIWTRSMENALNDYIALTDALFAEYSVHPLFKDWPKTDLRKKVREASRGVLPNDTATLIHMTGNIRAWRHFLEMRSSSHAEAGIRMVANEVYSKLLEECPILFGDYEKNLLPDGTFELTTKFKKV